MEKLISRIGIVNQEFETFNLKSVLTKNDAGDWGDEPKSDAIGVIRSTNFRNNGKLDLTNVAYRSLKPHKKIEKKVSEGDILVERSGGSDVQPVGRVGYINSEIATEDFAFANFIQRISIDESIDPKFLHYCLQQMYEMGITETMQNQTTGIRNLDWKQYIKSEFPKPPKPEQTAIAAILSKVDEAIEATENSIKATDKVKKSLMQNLLSGKLKPDGSVRKDDEFYMDEKFGRYPKDWNFSRFKDYAVLQRGKDLTDNDVIKGEYPVVKSNGVQIYHKDFFVEPPGVVTGRSGTIGKVFYIEDKFWAHNTSLYIKDFKGNCPKFIFYLIKRMDFRQYYAGTTVPTLNRNDIHRIKIALPKNYAEQELIANKIDECEVIISAKENKVLHLKKLKKSLMQNLLTGKARLDLKKLKSIISENKNG